MSGTINLAFTQQFDAQGDPLSGGLLYFYTAGTSSYQSAFQDTGLTITHPNPIILDASGRVPMFYLADGFIKVRLTDKTGVTIIAADQLLVIGPSGGTSSGGGGTPTSQAQLLATGDIKARYDTAVLDGFVRCNGNTIGNVGSSATERQEAICQPLFEHLWPFANITLDGFSKGANALADWGAGRRLILPDLRGRTIAGMDDMGATAAARLTALGLGTSIAGTVLGNAGGTQTHLLAVTEMPAHAHPSSTATSGGSHAHTISGSTGGQSADHTHGSGFSAQNSTQGGGNPPGGNSVNTGGASNDHTHDMSTGTISTHAGHTHPVTVTSQGGGGAHRNTQPTMVLTFYIKL